MRRINVGTIISAALVALAVLIPSAGKADPYKWCAVYGGKDGGGANCGFVTIEQCRATIRGMGGFCEPNQFYTGPGAKKARRARQAQTPTTPGGAAI